MLFIRYSSSLVPSGNLGHYINPPVDCGRCSRKPYKLAKLRARDFDEQRSKSLAHEGQQVEHELEESRGKTSAVNLKVR